MRVKKFLILTGPKPSISVAYGKFQMEVGSDDDSDSSDYYSDDSSDHDSSDDSHIVAQRVHLNKHENDRVLQLLPAIRSCVGVPFVTRLTTTNLKRHDMVYINISLSLIKLTSRGTASYPDRKSVV